MGKLWIHVKIALIDSESKFSLKISNFRESTFLKHFSYILNNKLVRVHRQDIFKDRTVNR